MYMSTPSQVLLADWKKEPATTSEREKNKREGRADRDSTLAPSVGATTFLSGGERQSAERKEREGEGEWGPEKRRKKKKSGKRTHADPSGLPA